MSATAANRIIPKFNLSQNCHPFKMLIDHAFIQQNPETIPINDFLEENVDVIPNDASIINNIPTDTPNDGVSIIDDVAVISKTNNTTFEEIAPIPVMPGSSGCQKRKHHAELLKSPEIIAQKRQTTQKRNKRKKEIEKIKHKQEKERKEGNEDKKEKRRQLLFRRKSVLQGLLMIPVRQIANWKCLQ
ncbi:unnamed protein product [Psylliodes chrysocephalus]|uniref:Uncharacterized protein n=1 Tax=Psylliodes chrysocephalus TaxID=3402493 RepID=A0A9P0GDK7_9CUCU|nr:unnamed protein product [Psylliodes chrysocephala]